MRILIADDHAIVRDGLRALLAHYPEMEVVGEAGDGEAAIRLAAELSPDVVIVDVAMPKLNGIEVVRRILEKTPEMKILALSMHINRHYVREILRAGALAYVVKSGAFEELARALSAIARGECYLSSAVAGVVVQNLARRHTLCPAEDDEGRELTNREIRMIELLVQGKSSKEIGRELHISPKTADANRRKIMEKLGVTNLVHLTKYAISEGLATLDF